MKKLEGRVCRCDQAMLSCFLSSLRLAGSRVVGCLSAEVKFRNIGVGGLIGILCVVCPAKFLLKLGE